MRFVGSKVEQPVLPDTVLALQLTANSAQAFDYPTACDFVRLIAGSTLTSGGPAVMFNPSSTQATVPTTAGAVTTASSGLNILVPQGVAMVFQRPRSSTGFSLVAPTSAFVSAEFWSRAGATG